jgi:hypothetical protein
LIGSHGGNGVPAIYTNTDGRVGIGSSNTAAGFALTVNADSGISGINVTNPVGNYILYSSKSGAGYGVLVEKTSTTSSSATIYTANAGSGQGVYGYSANGTGLYGYTAASAGPGSDPFGVSGVYGYNADYGYGVGGYCQNGTGIFGYSATYYAGYFSGDVFSTGN